MFRYHSLHRTQLHLIDGLLMFFLGTMYYLWFAYNVFFTDRAMFLSRYDACVSQCDSTLRRLSNAAEELSKYEKETTVFLSWMKQATRTMNEKEKQCSEDLGKIKNCGKELQDFLGDVIAHQADLR